MMGRTFLDITLSGMIIILLVAVFGWKTQTQRLQERLDQLEEGQVIMNKTDAVIVETLNMTSKGMIFLLEENLNNSYKKEVN